MSIRPKGAVVTVVTFAAVLSVLAAPSAGAAEVGDPNDVRGPFDFRWISAVDAPDDRIKLTARFYAPFRDWRIQNQDLSTGIQFQIDFLTGWFQRNRAGRLVFKYGDPGGPCCVTYRVVVLGARTLTVRPHRVDEGDPGVPIRGMSIWRRGEGQIIDRTDRIRLP